MAGELSEEEIKKLNDSIKGLAIRTKDAAKKLISTASKRFQTKISQATKQKHFENIF